MRERGTQQGWPHCSRKTPDLGWGDALLLTDLLGTTSPGTFPPPAMKAHQLASDIALPMPCVGYKASELERHRVLQAGCATEWGLGRSWAFSARVTDTH